VSVERRGGDDCLKAFAVVAGEAVCEIGDAPAVRVAALARAVQGEFLPPESQSDRLLDAHSEKLTHGAILSPAPMAATGQVV
jgi:hypothetical protein